NYYQNLTQSREQVKLEYKSKLIETHFPELLKQAQRKDLLLQRTTVGPHKDDYIFLMNDFPVKQFGSQGQQKSYVIALKLAQFELLSSHLHHKPLLLLDDIFDRLDQHRMSQLMQMVADHRFGQIFLTDTDLSRTRHTLSGLSDQINYYRVHQGEVELLNC
ncbi:MAG: DNA replication and repair protein RecF, partial [Hymenobacteraceae bacterium]|nr:DNA replication and repair protein RecF [Hymenobacteraceae bacterium]MDX5397534.1 DNA replication and repair protein RecF [Hymenobacteraceae bacterium]MDX5513612.1 DNA replication and repair protein RecF [Hymenobacteraceae bacterium]